MLLVKLNGVDITEKVDYNTVKITEQMNNRSNTCSFTVSNYMVPEGALIEIWEGSEITADVGSGVSTIPVDDTFEYFQKYRVGDTLRIPAGSSGAIKRVIQSVDHTAKTVTFTATLGTAYIKGTKVGRLIFAGVTMKNPDQEIGCSGVFVFNVTATDYTKLFDAKNIVDTFENMYSREIIGRSVYRYTATDLSIDMDDIESTAGITTGISAIGGTITTSGLYTIHTFTSSGSFTVSGGSLNVDSLVVAGGGGGGDSAPGGGGAGGVLYSESIPIIAGSHSVTVGTGGVPHASGTNSVFSSLTAIGGGRGASHSTYPAQSGGSGGGGGWGSVGTGASGTAGQGYAGGNGNTGSGGGAGGGGAGAASTYPAVNIGTAGGAGVSNSITGTAVTYGGGGGGGGNGGGGAGGAGGGGAGAGNYGAAGNGTNGLGGGGGGANGGTGGSGGSGVVIIRYLTPTPNVAITPVLDTTDKIYKNNSVQLGASGAGDAIYTVSFTAKDVTGTDNLRAWVKMPIDVTNWVSGIRFRMISTTGNYYEWNDTLLIQGGWSYDSFAYNRATISGTPNLASITSVEITLFALQAIPIGTFKIDHLFCTKSGFTIRNVERGITIFSDVRSQYKKPTVLLEDLAKQKHLYWYIDYERDVHFFTQETYTCPMEITDTSEVYGDLSITADISQMKNRQVVRGGEAVDAFTYTQDEVTDGKLESWRLDYKPKGLEIWVDTTGTGLSYVQKTVGVENLDDAASFDYLFNFNEKIVKRASAPLLADGTLFRRVYYPYKPIRVQVDDSASIVAMKALLGGDGVFDGALVTDLSIRSFQDARERAKAEIAPYKNPVITGTWQSDQDGWRAGQIVHIQDSNRGIDSSFVIQKVSRSQKTNGRWSYQIQAGSTMFGLIEFFQLLLRRSENLLIDVSEIVDIVKIVDEVISIGEVYRVYKKGPPWYAHTYNQQFSINTIGTEGGTANDAYADYCEAA